MGGVVLETESERIIRVTTDNVQRKTVSEIVRKMLLKGKELDEICDLCNCDLKFVQQVQEEMNQKGQH